MERTLRLLGPSIKDGLHLLLTHIDRGLKANENFERLQAAGGINELNIPRRIGQRNGAALLTRLLDREGCFSVIDFLSTHHIKEKSTEAHGDDNC